MNTETARQTRAARTALALRRFYEANPHFVLSPFSSDFGLSFLTPRLFGAFFGDMAGWRVLDLGCGSGVVGDVVLNLGAREYIGVDLVSTHFVPGPQKRFVEADINDLASVQIGSPFDCVLMLDVAEHLDNPAFVFSQARCRLREAGYFLVSVPNYANVAGLLKLLFEAIGATPRNTWAPFGCWQPQVHETLMTSFKQRRLLRCAGFTISAHLGMDIVSAALPVFYGKEGVWLKGSARTAYDWANRLAFRKFQGIARWVSMFSVMLARVCSSPGGGDREDDFRE